MKKIAGSLKIIIKKYIFKRQVLLLIFLIVINYYFNACVPQQKIIILPEKITGRRYLSSEIKNKSELLNALYLNRIDEVELFINNNFRSSSSGIYTSEYLLYEGIILYRKNNLKKAKAVMEEALTKAFLFDSSWKNIIQSNLRYIYYDLKEFNKLYYLEKETGEVSPFVNFLNDLSNEENYEIKTFDSSVTVPLKDFKGELRVPITINGKDEEYFIIDTASSLTVISSELAQKYKIKIINEGTAGYADIHLNSVVSVKYGKLDAIQIGDVTIYNIPVGIIDSESLTWKYMGGLFTYSKIDGILGLPVIREFTTTLDFPKKTLTLSLKNNSLPSTALKYNIFMVNSFIYVPVEMNGICGFNFCIDTGAEMTELYETGLKYLKQSSSTEIVIEESEGKKIENIYGEKKVLGIFYPNKFIINNYTLENLPILISTHNFSQFPIEEHGNLGLNVLKNFNITLDFKNMKMYLFSRKP
ncbi:retropepsin-like domain-containing protein [Candidatus Desantisbacteria bacterium]|nr:retropepsin-like domain-containing protein [Candidatus Desantisbacteria bacterium]